MNLTLIRSTLRTLLVTLSGLPDNAVIWRDQKRPFLPNVALLPRLSVLGSTNTDGRVYPYDPVAPAGAELTETIQCVRMLVLSIRAESLFHEDGQTAWDLLARIRDGLSFTTTRDALNAVKVAYVRELSFTDLTDSVLIDQRVRSIATLDIKLRAAASIAGPNTTYIETIEVSGP